MFAAGSAPFSLRNWAFWTQSGLAEGSLLLFGMQRCQQHVQCLQCFSAARVRAKGSMRGLRGSPGPFAASPRALEGAGSLHGLVTMLGALLLAHGCLRCVSVSPSGGLPAHGLCEARGIAAAVPKKLTLLLLLLPFLGCSNCSGLKLLIPPSLDAGVVSDSACPGCRTLA